MHPHQPRAQNLATANNFSFPSTTLSPSHDLDYDYGTWAERIKGQYNKFGQPSDVKPGAWTRRAPKNGDESSTPSPELSKKTESPVIESAESSPVRSYGNYSNRDNSFSHISHSARAQIIDKYRQEMLDLVRGMPETAYELSLRDIVESPKMTTLLTESAEDDKAEEEKSMDTAGLMLKMFIPRIPGVLKCWESIDMKVTPKPALGDAEKSGSENGADREWWSAAFEPMNSSSGSSSSSNSSGRRRRSR